MRLTILLPRNPSENRSRQRDAVTNYAHNTWTRFRDVLACQSNGSDSRGRNNDESDVKFERLRGIVTNV
jgi:hypothetical protein